MIGFNSPEYYFSLQGTWMAGCVTAGIYTTNSPEACEYVLTHSESRVCVCQSGKSAMKILSIRDNLPLLKAIVIYWPEDEMPEVEDKEGVNLIFSHHPQVAKVYRWDDFLKLGESIEEAEVDKRIDAIVPGNCATPIYTSGTTVC